VKIAPRGWLEARQCLEAPQHCYMLTLKRKDNRHLIPRTSTKNRPTCRFECCPENRIGDASAQDLVDKAATERKLKLLTNILAVNMKSISQLKHIYNIAPCVAGESEAHKLELCMRQSRACHIRRPPKTVGYVSQWFPTLKTQEKVFLRLFLHLL